MSFNRSVQVTLNRNRNGLREGRTEMGSVRALPRTQRQKGVALRPARPIYFSKFETSAFHGFDNNTVATAL